MSALGCLIVVEVVQGQVALVFLKFGGVVEGRQLNRSLILVLYTIRASLTSEAS